MAQFKKLPPEQIHEIHIKLKGELLNWLHERAIKKGHKFINKYIKHILETWKKTIEKQEKLR